MKWSALLFFLAVFILGSLLAWQEVKNYHLGYQISIKEEKLRSLEAENRNLLYTRALESSKELLVSRAKMMNIPVTEAERVVVIYVPKELDDVVSIVTINSTQRDSLSNR